MYKIHTTKCWAVKQRRYFWYFKESNFKNELQTYSSVQNTLEIYILLPHARIFHLTSERCTLKSVYEDKNTDRVEVT